MDLTVQELSDLLRVSETTLHTWIQEGNMPAYRWNDGYRFSRMEIEGWLLRQPQILATELGVSSGDLRFSLFKALYHGEVIPSLPVSTKEELITRTIEMVAQRFSLDAEGLVDLFLDRERLMSTGLGHGIAVPHTRDFFIQTPFDRVILVYPEQPLPFDAIDQQPVQLCFFLLAINDRHHLNLLSKIAHLAGDPIRREQLLQLRDRGVLLDSIRHWEGQLSV